MQCSTGDSAGQRLAHTLNLLRLDPNVLLQGVRHNRRSIFPFRLECPVIIAPYS